MGGTSIVTYHGALRTSANHIRSGSDLITDAPVDNNGKGAAFSPTDLVATSLASCMMTIMGIKSDSLDINIDGAKAEVVKVMASGPRRIQEIIIDVTMPEGLYEEEDKKILEKVAKACPVAQSLHSEIIQTINFSWS